MSENVTTAAEYQGIIVQINSDWRIVDFPTRWGLQKQDGDRWKKWGRPWRTVAGSHLRDQLAELVDTLAGSSADVAAAIADLPAVHAGHIGKPAGKRYDDYGGVVCVLGTDWRLIEERGVSQWTVQRRGRTRWNDVCYPRTRDEVEMHLRRAGQEFDAALTSALAGLPARRTSKSRAD